MEDERTGSLRVAVEKIAIGLVAVLVIYVLSIGPVYRFIYLEGGQKTRDVVAAFYTPIMWVSGHSEAVASAFDWYARIWNPIKM